MSVCQVRKLSNKLLAEDIMNKFENGKVYEIVSTDEDQQRVFVGSTTLPLSSRWSAHQHLYHKRPHVRLYQTMKVRGGLDRFEIRLLEAYPCESQQQLRTRVRHWIDRSPQLSNSRAIHTTPAEVREAVRQTMRRYHQQHAVQAREHSLKWYNKHKHEKVVCCCGATVQKLKIKQHLKSNKHRRATEPDGWAD